MKELELSLVVLEQILDNDVYFSDALKKLFQNNVEIKAYRKEVSGLVGCYLRHYLLLEHLTEEAGLSKRERRLVELTLANNYFYKHFEKEKIAAALKEMIGELTYDLIESLVNKNVDNDNYIPESISRSSNKYLSLRYNAPEWLLKIFIHFGYGVTYKTLKKISKPMPIICRVRTSLISVDEVCKIDGFVKHKLDGLVVYKGTTPIRKLEVFTSGKIFRIRPVTKFVFDKYRVEDPCEILLYNGNEDSSLERELLESYGHSIGLNLGVVNGHNRVENYKMIKEKELKNVNYFECKDPLSMEADISHQQDLVFCCPNSTNFDLIPFTPDYILHFKKEGMTSIFGNELNALEGCSKYVREGGRLVYIVYTISKKEGRGIVSSFIQHHGEFKVVEESQLFPCQELETAAYIAVLEKGYKEDSLSTPAVTDLNINAFKSVQSSISMDK